MRLLALAGIFFSTAASLVVLTDRKKAERVERCEESLTMKTQSLKQTYNLEAPVQRTLKDKPTFDECHVNKTVFSSEMRVLFVAGLEGSSHHAWKDVFGKCTRMTPQICVVNQDLSNELYLGKGAAASGIFVYGGQDTKALIDCKRSRFQVELLLARARSEDQGQRTLIWLNLANEIQNGMMSYPNYGDVDKELHHPDLVELARLCEDAGIDLRVVVLQRDAAAIIRSTVVHRHFDAEAHEAAMLADNAAALALQLQLLDDRFFRCVDFDDFASSGAANSSFWDETVPFLHPSLNSSSFKMAKGIVKKKAKERQDNEAAAPAENGTVAEEPFLEHLAGAVANIGRICKKADTKRGTPRP